MTAIDDRPATKTDPNWRDKGACRPAALPKWIDPDAFFPKPGETGAEAKSVCRDCPVRTTCLEDALGEGDIDGVYGGLTATERRNVLKQRDGLTPKRPGPKIHQPCGTPAAYQRHLRAGEPPCDPCAQANRLAAAQRREARPPKPCASPKHDEAMRLYAEIRPTVDSKRGAAAIVAHRTGLHPGTVRRWATEAEKATEGP